MVGMCRGRMGMGVSFVFAPNYGFYRHIGSAGDAVAQGVADDASYHACSCGVVYSTECHEYGEADEADKGDERFGGVSYRHDLVPVSIDTDSAC